MSAVVLLALAAIAADTWTSEEASGWVEPPAAPPKLGAWSTDLLDPDGLTRFHLTTRGLFSDGAQAISGSMAWSYEARAHIRLTKGIALSGVVPISHSIPEFERTRIVFGNVGIGGVFGRQLSTDPLAIRLGGSLDLYFPTSPKPEVGTIARDTLVTAFRAYEPQLYVPRLFSARIRAHADFTIEPLTLEGELSLIPGATIGPTAQFVMLFSAAGRVSARLGSVFEPYLEAACAPQIAGAGEIAPPLLITPGLRLHIADSFDPAVFVSFNFVATSAVIFGVDLAAVVRPSTSAQEASAKRRGFHETHF